MSRPELGPGRQPRPLPPRERALAFTPLMMSSALSLAARITVLPPRFALASPPELSLFFCLDASGESAPSALRPSTVDFSSCQDPSRSMVFPSSG
mgnify:CR=1 FL=1